MPHSLSPCVELVNRPLHASACHATYQAMRDRSNFVNVRIPRETFDRLEPRATGEARSVSNLVALLLLEALEKKKQKGTGQTRNGRAKVGARG